jgi:DNA-binding transcriptional regulator YhcF (GntR family)
MSPRAGTLFDNAPSGCLLDPGSSSPQRDREAIQHCIYCSLPPVGQVPDFAASSRGFSSGFRSLRGARRSHCTSPAAGGPPARVLLGGATPFEEHGSRPPELTPSGYVALSRWDDSEQREQDSDRLRPKRRSEVVVSTRDSGGSGVPVSKTEYVVARLEADIADGLIDPGQTLRQHEIATRYGVSATPVREALRILAAEGIVRYSAHKSATVAEMEPVELEDLYALRARISLSALREELSARFSCSSLQRCAWPPTTAFRAGGRARVAGVRCRSRAGSRPTAQA